MKIKTLSHNHLFSDSGHNQKVASPVKIKYYYYINKLLTQNRTFLNNVRYQILVIALSSYYIYCCTDTSRIVIIYYYIM